MLAVYLVFFLVAGALICKSFGRESQPDYDANEKPPKVGDSGAFPKKVNSGDVFHIPGKYSILFAFGAGFGVGGLLGLLLGMVDPASLLPAFGGGILLAGAMWGVLECLSTAAMVWAVFENVTGLDSNSDN
jgi:hypothetical protein